ncbi:MAG: hypothetical protein CME70_10365 [Halobacteriovorax sp.]|nr:hypothetical protein [Halobacteriovorax sp.]|tara:strand:+ start:141868 stop:142191 length:324 start_codon:yes stop_codon:yes gene_type:complete
MKFISARLKYMKRHYEKYLRDVIKQAQIIDIDVEKFKNGYQAKVQLTSRGRVFCATKTSETINDSIKKASLAIVRQANKAYRKNSSKHNRKEELYSLEAQNYFLSAA